MAIERDADDVARCFLLERAVEDGCEREFEGEVVGLIGAGAFVAFGDGYEGMLPVRRLRGDWWELNEQGTILVGERTGATLRLGDRGARAGGAASTRRAGASDLLPVRALGSDDGQGKGKRKIGAGRRRVATATRRYRYDLLERLECGHRARGHRGQGAARRAAPS